jgi:8-oxo-dGTP diphosphatase
MSKNLKEVVVVLPINVDDKSVLMQLRDDKPGIDAPGLWGFFGGGIDNGECPKDGAIRELEEEIGFQVIDIYHLSSGLITDLDGIYAHAFTVKLMNPINKLTLNEGRDFKMVRYNEVLRGTVYSNKFQCFFPTVKTCYIKKCFVEAINFWDYTN